MASVQLLPSPKENVVSSSHTCRAIHSIPLWSSRVRYNGLFSLFDSKARDRLVSLAKTSMQVDVRMDHHHHENLMKSKILLPPGLRQETMPKHVAIIMDGNSRWAKKKGLPVAAGHEAGVKALKGLMKLSLQWGIQVLTVFGFSLENWQRPQTEVDFIMKLFERVLRVELDGLMRDGIQLRVIGDSTQYSKSLQKLVIEAEELTRNNTRFQLIAAIGYSGRNDIMQACRRIALKVKDNQLVPEDITESIIEQELATSCAMNYPFPDFLIRTSGEQRLSNFLLWQLAYTELHFSNSLWPDFGEDDYLEALLAFQQRHRRFGGRPMN